MEQRQLNVFSDAHLAHDAKLAIARDLERLYSSLVAEPIPPELQDFVERLGRALGHGPSRPPHSN
jgi:hypothetical protein